MIEKKMDGKFIAALVAPILSALVTMFNVNANVSADIAVLKASVASLSAQVEKLSNKIYK